ncbi:MAG: MmgE/PrpD family protein [Chloroflexota bacterium]
MDNLSAIYANYVCNSSYENLTAPVISQAKQSVMDLIGVSLAGYKLMEFPQHVVNYTAGLGGKPEATIIAKRGKKFPALNAAFANGACAHALDMDDGHRLAAGHPGAAVIPAAIACAEQCQASTKDLISGVVVGYEVTIRIASAINPSSLSRGFHTTGTTGPFGAAAAAANIMHLNKDETIGALGLAGLQGAGLLEVMHDDEAAKVKSIHTARAAMAGLFAADIARKGVRGPTAILEGEDGFLRAMADKINPELLTRGLGQTFEIMNTYTKFYAACRHVHVSIDAALATCRREHIDPEEITGISIETYPVALKMCSTVHPLTPSAARFSLSFCVALALIKGDAGADKFSAENVNDDRIQNLAGKVKSSVSSKWEKLYPGKRGTTVSITDVRGITRSTEMELAIGEPETPASTEDVSRKFYNNVTLLVSKSTAKKMEEVILNLENMQLSDLTECLEG